MELISSPNNPQIKHLIKLQQKAGERKKNQAFVIEGRREISLAMQNETTILDLFVCEDVFAPLPEYPIVFSNAIKTRNISRDVYNKIAYRKDAEGIIACAKTKRISLNELKNISRPLYIVLESIEKPGNLGAILRTADAAGVNGVIICDARTDIFNPNVIRSALGCSFTVPIAVCSFEEYQIWAKSKQIRTAVASLQTTELYYEKQMDVPLALVFGTEADGLTEKWYNIADIHCKIPMLGQIDSLNLSNSVAILVYEAVRQRQQK